MAFFLVISLIGGLIAFYFLSSYHMYQGKVRGCARSGSELHGGQQRGFRTLRSFPFLLALGLLLLNDFWLKQSFGNVLTGKLSDFAGLFVFPLFWTALFPKAKRWIFLFTAFLFILWKSPYATAFIEWWNGLLLFPIGRVVDPTDLWALLILPFAYRFDSSTHRSPLADLPPILPLSITTFAFLATSYMNNVDCDEEYRFDLSKEHSLQNIHASKRGVKARAFYEPVRDQETDSVAYYVHRFGDDTLDPKEYERFFRYDKDTLTATLRDTGLGSFKARFLVKGGEQKTTVHCVRFTYTKPPDEEAEKRFPGIFEKELIDPLRELEEKDG